MINFKNIDKADALKPLDKKSLLHYLNFDDETWEKNKDMLGYKDGEKYEDFFYRIHGFEAHEQDDEFKKENEPIYFYLGRLENEIKELKKMNLKITQLEIKTENMENELTNKVKDYKKQSSVILKSS